LRIELDETDINNIASRVIEGLKPIVQHKCSKQEERDIIFDIKGLAEYLSVSKKWIYEQTSFRSIPHYKLTNKQLRFKKSEIDQWLNAVKRTAISEPTKLRLISR
jgi:excisionase family DNA binding protein